MQAQRVVLPVVELADCSVAPQALPGTAVAYSFLAVRTFHL